MATHSLHDEVESAIHLYETLNKHYATRTRQMIADHGEIGALSRLMLSADLQVGFKTLRDAGKLDRTFESVVIRNRDLFPSEIVEAAQWRLDHPYQLL